MGLIHVPLRKITGITILVIVISVSILITIDHMEKADPVAVHLQDVLDKCKENNTDLPNLVYQNETHLITTSTCEWREIWHSNCLEPTSKQPHEDASWNLDSCYWFVDYPYTPYDD